MINTKITNLEDSIIKIEVEIPEADLAPFKTKALEHLGQTVQVAGFRSGHIPPAILESKVGEDRIFEEMANEAISHFYPQILADNKIDSLGRPDVIVTKLAKGNPLCFTATTTVLPKVELPDYKKIVKETKKAADKPATITDEEVNATLEELRKGRAIRKDLTEKIASTEPTTEDAPEITEEAEAKDSLILPELNDDFAKSLGKFEDLNDLKLKIKTNLQAEKDFETKERLRLAILEAIAAKVDLAVPKLLIDNENHKMLHELEYEISKMGLKLDDYLKHISKTKEEITASWEPEATKRVKLGLVTNAIIEAEKVVATTEEIDNVATTLLLQAHSHSEPTGEELARLRAYAENTVIHDKVWAILEE